MPEINVNDVCEADDITGSKFVTYVLWGATPEDPTFKRYGFATEAEQSAFVAGVQLAEGWMGVMIDSDTTASKFYEEIMHTYEWDHLDFDEYPVCPCTECKEEENQ